MGQDLYSLEQFHVILFIHVVYFFMWGACTGSLLNVVIYRLPRGESLVWPPSRCLNCGRRVRIAELFPIFNYFALRGRCRGCSSPIHWRYPFVEFMAASLCALTGYLNAGNDFGHWQNVFLMMGRMIFVCVLIAIFFIDLDLRIIPDKLSITGTLSGLVFAFLAPAMHMDDVTRLSAAYGGEISSYDFFTQGVMGLIASLGGAVVGGGIILGMRLLGRAMSARSQQAVSGEDPALGGMVGLGDVKLMAMVGAFVGWERVFCAIMLGILLAAASVPFVKFFTGRCESGGSGALARLSERWRTGALTMPFGPFLVGGALMVLWFGDPILRLLS